MTFAVTAMMLFSSRYCGVGVGLHRNDKGKKSKMDENVDHTAVRGYVGAGVIWGWGRMWGRGTHEPPRVNRTNVTLEPYQKFHTRLGSYELVYVEHALDFTIL